MTDLREILAEATPGPWRADMMELAQHPRIETEEMLIADVGNAENWQIAKDEWEANARLIALAPTLAATLLKAEESLKVALNDLDEWVACKDSLEKAGFNMDDTADRAEIVRTALSEIASITGGGNG